MVRLEKSLTGFLGRISYEILQCDQSRKAMNAKRKRLNKAVRCAANAVLITNSFNYIKGVRLETISGPARDLRIYHGEFDPGSERTLAARLKHASRTASCSNTA